MKTIVYYYSHSGNNEYLAKKIADDLNCPIEKLRPKLNIHLLMLMGLNFGNKQLINPVQNFDQVIVCGPIWMGKLIVPLKNFISENTQNIKSLVFVTCCGSSFAKKDEKFGFNLVFKEIKALLGNKCKKCEAFPIDFIIPEDQKNNSDFVMKTRLNDSNFKGEIVNFYNTFIEELRINDEFLV